MQDGLAEIYTDGSCHTQQKIGTWVAIILVDTGKKILSGTAKDTSHNRMELTAVTEAIDYIKNHYGNTISIKVYTDSQYVKGLPVRKEKLVKEDFTSGKGNPLQNADLVKTFFKTISKLSVELVKIKAHQKSTDVVNYNREADMLSRKLLRNAVDEISN